MRQLTVLSAALLTLAACTASNNAVPQDVLERSALANQSIESATFSIESDFTLSSAFLGGQSEGRIRSSGFLQNGGKQLKFVVMGEGVTGKSKNPWEITADAVVAGEQEVYIRVNHTRANASINPSIAALEQIKGVWLALPSNTTSPEAALTPDPSMLKMQAEVIDVLEDKGIDRIGGRKTHHYVVTVNTEKLAEFLKQTSAQRNESFDESALRASMEPISTKGDIWIDADTYHVRRIKWIIDSANTNEPMHIKINADIINAPGQLPIVPPTNTANLPATGILPPF